MIKPPIPANEKERLQNIKEYQILDSLPESEYDDITKLASVICRTPMSLITIIDENRQWFKSAFGINATETPREYAFCAHAILNPDEMLIVEDSRSDERFMGNPSVTGEPHIIFYAGVPLVSTEGFAWGTLCVADSQPKNLSTTEIEALKSLSRQVVKLLELRKAKILLESRNKSLETKTIELSNFAQVAAHDLKSPLSSIAVIIGAERRNCHHANRTHCGKSP